MLFYYSQLFLFSVERRKSPLWEINNLVSCAAGARDAQVVDLDVLSSVLSVFVWTQSWWLCQEMADGCDTFWGMQAVRAVWVYHITWFVNSASHVWGTQVWNTGDLSRNNWLVSTVIPLISSMHTVPSKVLVCLTPSLCNWSTLWNRPARRAAASVSVIYQVWWKTWDNPWSGCLKIFITCIWLCLSANNHFLHLLQPEFQVGSIACFWRGVA